jgi:hypothetical protein
MKFAPYMAFSFIILYHVLLVPFSYHRICSCMFCMILFNFVNYEFLLLCLCILNVMYVLFLLCCSMYCLRVIVYCTTATGCQPNCS